MQVPCQQCGAVIVPPDLNVEQGLAKCPACGAVFQLQIQTLPIGATKPVVALPRSMKVEEAPNELRITQRWIGFSVIPLMIFCAVWDTFCLTFIVNGIRHHQYAIFAIIPIHGLVGVGLTYGVFAMLLNTTTIRVGRRGFDVRHHPVPVPGINRLVAGELTQVYCKEKVTNSKNGVNRTYSVQAVTDDGRDEIVVKGLTSSDQALFIEQAIERFLGIKDRPIPGEFGQGWRG